MQASELGPPRRPWVYVALAGALVLAVLGIVLTLRPPPDVAWEGDGPTPATRGRTPGRSAQADAPRTSPPRRTTAGGRAEPAAPATPVGAPGAAATAVSVAELVTQAKAAAGAEGAALRGPLERLAALGKPESERALLEMFGERSGLAGNEALWAQVLASVQDERLASVVLEVLRQVQTDGPASAAASPELWKLALSRSGADAPRIAAEVLETWGLAPGSLARSAVFDALPDVAAPDLLSAARRELEGSATATVTAAGRALLRTRDPVATQTLLDYVSAPRDAANGGLSCVQLAKPLGAQLDEAQLTLLRSRYTSASPVSAAVYVSAVSGTGVERMRAQAEDVRSLVETAFQDAADRTDADAQLMRGEVSAAVEAMVQHVATPELLEAFRRQAQAHAAEEAVQSAARRLAEYLEAHPPR